MSNSWRARIILHILTWPSSTALSLLCQPRERAHASTSEPMCLRYSSTYGSPDKKDSAWARLRMSCLNVGSMASLNVGSMSTMITWRRAVCMQCACSVRVCSQPKQYVSTWCLAIRAALASTRRLASRGISCVANMMVTTSLEKGSP
eukprot:scaffold122389_cov69-Phaeocystis_antarctica.AAC.3